MQLHKTLLICLLGCAGLACRHVSQPAVAFSRDTVPIQAAEPNDNRTPAGVLRDGVLTIELDAVSAAWKPDRDVDTAVTVRAFAERGRAPQVPGPLIRVPAGTEIRAMVRNTLEDSTVVVWGLSDDRSLTDTVHITPGATRELRFRAAIPGTYLYSARASMEPLAPGVLSGRDAQLRGAIVVDPAGALIDPDERIFVLTLIDVWPDTARGIEEDIWEAAINGQSWPHTERLRYDVGDTVRWRWINATDRPHPMHLHGFHFEVTAKGNGRTDSRYEPGASRHAVTEFMPPGTTFEMRWVPTRAGNWLMHCHMIPHIVPYPERPLDARAHDMHDPMRHAEQAMAGLVLGVQTEGVYGDDVALRRGGTSHRLLVQESRRDTAPLFRRGYVLQRGAEPAPDSVEVPGSPLITVRDQTTTVTIVNRLTEPTSVHWHGMELESVFDGVPGYSGLRDHRSPLIAPNDSFTVSFTPPRAGTYMYHTHMDEEDQLAAGLYAPLLVLEPGDGYDPATDLTLVVGLSLGENGERTFAINGRAEPTPISVHVSETHRLRLINLLLAPAVRVWLITGADTLRWRPISKDGADLPPTLSVEGPATVARVGVGEAYDFEWTPLNEGEAILMVEVQEPGGIAGVLRQRFMVERSR